MICDHCPLRRRPGAIDRGGEIDHYRRCESRRHRAGPNVDRQGPGRGSGTVKHAAFLIAALLLSACQPTYTLELYDGPQREDEHVATIVPLRGCFHCVRWLQLTGKQNTIYTYPVKESPFDTPAVPEKFRVPPGRYEVYISARLGKNRRRILGWRG